MRAFNSRFFISKPFQYANIKDGHYELSRVDVNETWHLNNEKEVLAWIRAVGESA
ncbi:phage/plasmid replication protein, partial [Acinetobacter baumannii]|uniref:phage/plasmid replication domain-containing protein n=1 Tax=Acinetobacter baumannii TaxID=470 RepID=UPI00294AAF1D